MERLKICFAGTFWTISCFIFVSVFPFGAEGLSSESESSVNGSSSGLRYQLAVFDFERVELPYVICLWILIVSLAKIAFHLHHKLPQIVPESCLLIVLGLIVGAVLHYSHAASTSEYVLDAEVFFIYLLPPIIFDAGYFMPVRAFFDNIGTILLLAFINTCISAGLIGVSLYGISLMGWFGRTISILDCFIFSSLISAVDPVAVLSVFEEVHVNQMLYIIVFGESLLNDGVTVVLYHMMEGFIEIGEDNLIATDVVSGIGSFFIVAIGGSLIGILFGFFGGFITKYTEHVRVIEPLFVFVLGYMMYLTSEMVHLSSILALSFGGIVLRHYLEANVSSKTRTSIKYFMKMLAHISETIIFMFLGLSTIVDTLDWNLSFIFFALLFCLVYRVLGIMILSYILNRRRLVKLTGIDQFVMAYGGLRGGIAFCLSLSLKEELVPEKRLFVTATIIIVFFTVFVQGITIKPVVNALNVKKELEGESTLNEKIHETVTVHIVTPRNFIVKRGEAEVDNEFRGVTIWTATLSEMFIDHLMAGLEGITKRSGHNLMRIKFRHINHQYLKPIFNKEVPKTKNLKVLDHYHNLSVQDALDRLESSADVTSVGQKIPLIKSEFAPRGFDPDVGIPADKTYPYISKSEDDSHLHHLLDEGMIPAQRTWFRHRKNTISEVMPEFKKHSKSVTVSKIVTESFRGNDEAALKMNQQNGETECEKLKNGETEHQRLQNGESEHERQVADDTSALDALQVSENEQISSSQTATEKELPWKTRLSQDQALQISSNLLITSDEPCTSEAPTWVDNLSYNHLKESLSPYASPEVTVIAVKEDIKTPVFDLFPSQDNNGVADVALPVPWSKASIDSNSKDDEPVSSLAVLTRSGDKSDQYLQSNHMLRPPSYHVIIPTPDSGSVSQDFDDEFHKPLRTLPGSASAPDLPKHRQLLEHFSRDQLQTESFLQELNFQEEVSNRVHDWLESSGSCDVNGEPEVDTTFEDDDGGIAIDIPEIEITHL